jgi:hypothetical protein
MTKRKSAKARKSRTLRTLRAKTLGAKTAGNLRGGGKRRPEVIAGSLDAGIHFKYDLKAQKEG